MNFKPELSRCLRPIIVEDGPEYVDPAEVSPGTDIIGFDVLAALHSVQYPDQLLRTTVFSAMTNQTISQCQF